MGGLLAGYVTTKIKNHHPCYNYINKSFIIHCKYHMNYQTIKYIVNITVINIDNHNYCIIMSNLTNDRNIKRHRN